jgi:hypothetical protein
MDSRDYLNGLLDEFLATRVYPEASPNSGAWPEVSNADLAALRNIISCIVAQKFVSDSAGDPVIQFALCDRNKGRLFSILDPRFDENTTTPVEVATDLLRRADDLDHTANKMRERAQLAMENVRDQLEAQAAAREPIDTVYAMIEAKAPLDEVRPRMAAMMKNGDVRRQLPADYAMLSRTVAQHYGRAFADDIKAIQRLLLDPDPVRLMAARERILQLQIDAGTDVAKELVFAYNDILHPARTAARKAGLPVTDDIESIHPFFD